MIARIFTGTLTGPEGTTVGRFVKYETAHNLQMQVDFLLEGLRMAAQGDTLAESKGLAQDTLDGHYLALRAAGTSH